jgi:hypothetical protein
LIFYDLLQLLPAHEGIIAKNVSYWNDLIGRAGDRFLDGIGYSKYDEPFRRELAYGRIVYGFENGRFQINLDQTGS